MQHQDTNTASITTPDKVVVIVNHIVHQNGDGLVVGAFGVCSHDGSACYINGRTCAEQRVVKGMILECYVVPNPVAARRERTPWAVAEVLRRTIPSHYPTLEYAGHNPKPVVEVTPTPEYRAGDQMELPLGDKPEPEPEPEILPLFKLEKDALDTAIQELFRTHKNTAFSTKGVSQGLLLHAHGVSEDCNTLPEGKVFYDRVRHRLEVGHKQGKWALLQASTGEVDEAGKHVGFDYGWPLYTYDRTTIYQSGFAVRR